MAEIERQAGAAIHDHADPTTVGFAEGADPKQIAEAATHAALLIRRA